jgi:hypothetical protein
VSFDPRDYDSRDDLRLPEPDSRERDNDGLDLGHGPGNSPDSHYDGRHSREDERRPDRDRIYDPREAFTGDLNLPRGLEREIVRDRDREYTLRARKRVRSRPSVRRDGQRGEQTGARPAHRANPLLSPLQA